MVFKSNPPKRKFNILWGEGGVGEEVGVTGTNSRMCGSCYSNRSLGKKLTLYYKATVIMEHHNQTPFVHSMYFSEYFHNHFL
jgi:hypothetical protein